MWLLKLIFALPFWLIGAPFASLGARILMFALPLALIFSLSLYFWKLILVIAVVFAAVLIVPKDFAAEIEIKLRRRILRDAPEWSPPPLISKPLDDPVRPVEYQPQKSTSKTSKSSSGAALKVLGAVTDLDIDD